jgi:hypothetical protein
VNIAHFFFGGGGVGGEGDTELRQICKNSNINGKIVNRL